MCIILFVLTALILEHKNYIVYWGVARIFFYNIVQNPPLYKQEMTRCGCNIVHVFFINPIDYHASFVAVWVFYYPLVHFFHYVFIECAIYLLLHVQPLSPIPLDCIHTVLSICETFNYTSFTPSLEVSLVMCYPLLLTQADLGISTTLNFSALNGTVHPRLSEHLGSNETIPCSYKWICSYKWRGH